MVSLQFNTITEKKPNHGDNIVWLRKMSDFGHEGYYLVEIVVEYSWEYIDSDGFSSGYSVCYNDKDNIDDFEQYRLDILFDGISVDNDDLWCYVTDYWKSFDNINEVR